MNTTEVIYLSKQGMKELKQAIESLQRDREQAIQELRELDRTDGHDERYTRVEKLAHLESIENELHDKQAYLNSAQLFPRKRDRLKVALGSVVELIDKSGKHVIYTLVDSIEANPSDGRISIKSPLGQNLLGKTTHDIVQWGNGLKTNQFQLVRIS